VSDLPGTTTTHLVKSGPGTWVLTNPNNNHLGTTTVLGGMLVVNGSITGSATTVQSGATLSGSGSLAALTVASGGNLAPGNSPGTLNTGTFDLQSGAHFKLELGGLAANQSDRVNVTGTVNLAGDLQISLFGGFVPQIGDRFFAIINDGADAIAGTFSNDDVLQRITIDGATFQLNYADNFGGAGAGNDLSLTMVAVPEPASAALLLLGGLGLVARRRRS
jgi:autotransporter-associated beta strand protein